MIFVAEKILVAWQENKYRYKIILFGIILLLMLWPVQVLRLENSAKEEAKYIRRIHDEHSVGQVFELNHPVDAIDFFIRAEQKVDTTLVLQDRAGYELGRERVQLDQEDQWVRIHLDAPLESGRREVHFVTEPSVPRESAVLVRFQIDSDRYEAGNMIVDKEDSYGDVAFRLREKVPLAKGLLVWGQVTDSSFYRGAPIVVFSLLVMLGGLVVVRNISQFSKKFLIAAGIILLVGLAIVVRAPYTLLIQGVFGGDAFNYFSKAQALFSGMDPFVADFRKAPLWSFLIAPGLFMPDPMQWSRWLGVLLSAGIAGLVPWLVRLLGGSWPVALVAGLLSVVNLELIWEAPSGLANVLYAFLILFSVIAYLKAREKGWLWVLAISLGLIVLTRYEGAVVAAILWIAIWVRDRVVWRRYILATFLLAAIALLPMSSLVWSGETGIRTWDDIESDGGLFLATSPDAWEENIREAKKHIQNMWVFTQEKNRTPLFYPAILIGVVFAMAIRLVSRRWRDTTLQLLGIGLVIGLGVLTISKSSEARDVLIALPGLLLGVGMVVSWQQRPRDVFVIWLVIVAQLAVVTGILPKSRYYVQLIPWFVLLISLGMGFLAERLQWRGYSYGLVFTGAMLAGVFYVDGSEVLRKRLEQYNERASTIAVMMEAGRWLRERDGNVGFRPTEEQSNILYIPDDRRFDYSGPGEAIIDEELRWLRENDIRWAVGRDNEVEWVSAKENPIIFSVARWIGSGYGEARVTVYEIDWQ